MALYKNKYRIESNRKPGWDYSSNALYYITIMVQHRKCLLGKIENDEMILSEFGKIADREWHNSFEIRQELFLDEYIMMPNHIHAIVVICIDIHTHVDIHGREYLHGREYIQPKFYRKPKSISSFVGGYKSGITTKIDDFIDLKKLPINKYNKENKFWQPNYHDHIIRNNEEYWRIKKYIQNNPKNWKGDPFLK